MPKPNLHKISSRRGHIYYLPLAALIPAHDFNERRDFGDIGALADDIEHLQGVKTPMTVRSSDDGKVHVLHGERRFRALTLLAERGILFDVPCITEAPGTTETTRLFEQLSTNSGKPFTLLEKGRTYRRILEEDPDIKPADLARACQASKTAISNALTIIDKGAPAIHKAIDCDKIAATTALVIIKDHPDHDDQATALKEVFETAASQGKEKVTPAHVPPSPKKEETEASCVFTYTPLGDPDSEPNEHGVFLDGHFIRLTKSPASWKITEMDIAWRTWEGKNTFARSITVGTSTEIAFLSLPTDLDTLTIAEGLARLLANCEPKFATKHQTTIIHEAFVACLLETYDDLSICSLTEFDKALEEARTNREATTPSANDALDRIRETEDPEGSGNSGSGGGGGGGGFSGGGSTPSPDKRIKTINETLEELNSENCNTTRWETVEFILTFLDGAHNKSDLKKHLKQAS